MHRLSFLILIFLLLQQVNGQSPHGDDFELDCSLCHQPDNWNVIPEKIQFDHSSADFKLTGQHRNIYCRGCHTQLIFRNTPKNCFSCHKDIHRNTTDSECSRCHSTDSWVVKNIITIHQESRFPLSGAHKIAECESCHKNFNNLIFEPLETLCFNCHSTDFYSAKSPDHLSSGFSADCESCHSLNSYNWAAGNFQHNFFPLTGGHNIERCFSCHINTNFKGLSAECISCHRKDYEAADEPDHIAAGFTLSCNECHNINNWEDAEFEHNKTDFPLLGAHINVNCSSCHINIYSGTSGTCISCHNEAYIAAKNPDHQAAAISADCRSCHSFEAWIPSSFQHSLTGFILEGQHNLIQCSSCHKGVISGLNPACFSCHSNQYTSAPNHSTQSYPVNCEMCHNAVSWSQTNFNHQNTLFPLTGAHETIVCSACHTGGFTGTSTDCFDCHTASYSGTQNPDHSAIQIPVTCKTCHTTNPGWKPAVFPIHNNYYLLEGAHAIIQNNCYDCHKGNYNQTTNTCFGCHADKYNSTVNPNHTAAGFPVECTSCHSQSQWVPASWDHDIQYFPIYSGKHSGKWDKCTDCHNNPLNFKIFTCLNCHIQTETNADHSEVNGYIYESSACLSCHPRGDNNMQKLIKTKIKNQI